MPAIQLARGPRGRADAVSCPRVVSRLPCGVMLVPQREVRRSVSPSVRHPTEVRESEPTDLVAHPAAVRRRTPRVTLAHSQGHRAQFICSSAPRRPPFFSTQERNTSNRGRKQPSCTTRPPAAGVTDSKAYRGPGRSYWRSPLREHDELSPAAPASAGHSPSFEASAPSRQLPLPPSRVCRFRAWAFPLSTSPRQ